MTKQELISSLKNFEEDLNVKIKFGNKYVDVDNIKIGKFVSHQELLEDGKIAFYFSNSILLDQ